MISDEEKRKKDKYDDLSVSNVKFRGETKSIDTSDRRMNHI
jgi:hypothetical protein